MKAAVTLASIIVLISCSGVRNDDGEARFGKSLTTATTRDNPVYKVIDTAKIYQLVASYYKYDAEKTNTVARYNLKKYLKFYGDGRLAVFDDFNLNTLDTLTSRVTDQGYYEYSYKTLYTRNFLTNKSGKQFYNPQWHTKNGDTLSLYSESTKNMSHYLPIELPTTIFVEKANW